MIEVCDRCGDTATTKVKCYYGDDHNQCADCAKQTAWERDNL